MAAATPAIVRLLRRVLDEASIPDVVTGPYLADETEARFGAAGRKSRLTRSSATRTPGTRTVVRATAPFHGAADAHLPHQPLNPLPTDGDTVGAQVTVDPWRAVGTTARDMELPHPLQQQLVADSAEPTAASSTRHGSRSG
jgi:hypothetical protein